MAEIFNQKDNCRIANHLSPKSLGNRAHKLNCFIQKEIAH